MDLASAFEAPTAASVPLVPLKEELLHSRKRSRSNSAASKEEEDERRPAKRRRALRKDAEDPDKTTRTLFVANLPVSVTKKQLKRLIRDEVVSKVAEGDEPPTRIVESVRFRSVPLEATKIQPGKDHHEMRKVC